MRFQPSPPHGMGGEFEDSATVAQRALVAAAQGGHVEVVEFLLTAKAWAPVSELGFLDFQILRFWILEILCFAKYV